MFIEMGPSSFSHCTLRNYDSYCISSWAIMVLINWLSIDRYKKCEWSQTSFPVAHGSMKVCDCSILTGSDFKKQALNAEHGSLSINHR